MQFKSYVKSDAMLTCPDLQRLMELVGMDVSRLHHSEQEAKAHQQHPPDGRVPQPSAAMNQSHKLLKTINRTINLFFRSKRNKETNLNHITEFIYSSYLHFFFIKGSIQFLLSRDVFIKSRILGIQHADIIEDREHL